MRDENCIFCKIIEGKIPSRTIFEDNDFKVIMDVSPATRGHCLVLPKAHFADLYELPEELVAKAFVLAKRMCDKLTKALGADGFNIAQNNKQIAGQTVFHFHIHLIPRYLDEEKPLVMWDTLPLDTSEMDSIWKQILGEI